jgi:N-acetyl-anhydromuramyl-L-alanine amidase AmpD
MKILYAVAILLSLVEPSSRPAVIDRLMPLDHSSPRPANAVIDAVVLHFSSDCVANPDHPYDVDRQIKIYNDAKVSTHYLIDREGTIYRLVDEKRTAWHAGKGSLPWDKARTSMNSTSIGIEMLAIGSAADMKIFMSPAAYAKLAKAHPQLIGFTDAEYASLDRLLDDLVARHPQIKKDRFHIVGHEEWAGRTRRTDPGELFDWTRIGLTRDRPESR